MKDKERVYFKAEWDWRVKYVSYGLLFFFFLISFFMLHAAPIIIIFVILFISWIAIVLSYFFSPSGYSLNDNAIFILTKIKKIKILLSDIEEINEFEKEELAGGIRIFGIGGLFGYTGIFYSKKLGFYIYFSTNYNSLVMIKSKRTYVISPEKRDLFLESIKKKMRL